MSKRPLIELVERFCALQGQTPGRERILAWIFCGDVLINGERCREAKRTFPETAVIEIKNLGNLAGDLLGALAQAGAMPDPSLGRTGGDSGDGQPVTVAIPKRPFVSRGGDKLDSVLEAWRVPVASRIWLDAGCSTGGFTHCLLLRGAKAVHAVDVGYNQLDWRLRNHPAVLVHERTNIMGLESLDPRPAAAVADLSFRSMAGAAKRILTLCTDNELYALIKPQFERKYFLAGQIQAMSFEGDMEDAAELATEPEPDEDIMDQPGPVFSGVVSPGESRSILEDLMRRLAAEGIVLEKLARAGLKGRTGNQEYLALLRQSDDAEKALAVRGLSVIAGLF